MKSSIIKVPVNGGLIKYVRVIHIMESDATNEKMKQTYMERYPHYIERKKTPGQHCLTIYLTYT